jgi:hypothetical protein
MIEKDRHRKINLANRICPLCRSEVEDEFHFSMICDKLKNIRDEFFQKLTDIVPLFSNFSDLDKFFFITFSIYFPFLPNHPKIIYLSRI